MTERDWLASDSGLVGPGGWVKGWIEAVDDELDVADEDGDLREDDAALAERYVDAHLGVGRILRVNAYKHPLSLGGLVGAQARFNRDSSIGLFPNIELRYEDRAIDADHSRGELNERVAGEPRTVLVTIGKQIEKDKLVISLDGEWAVKRLEFVDPNGPPGIDTGQASVSIADPVPASRLEVGRLTVGDWESRTLLLRISG